jgi:hypothetical protein
MKASETMKRTGLARIFGERQNSPRCRQTIQYSREPFLPQLQFAHNGLANGAPLRLPAGAAATRDTIAPAATANHPYGDELPCESYFP